MLSPAAPLGDFCTDSLFEEDLDYFAALDVAAAEASPHVADAQDVPGPSTGRRRRRAVAKRRVSGAEGVGFV